MRYSQRRQRKRLRSMRHSPSAPQLWIRRCTASTVATAGASVATTCRASAGCRTVPGRAHRTGRPAAAISGRADRQYSQLPRAGDSCDRLLLHTRRRGRHRVRGAGELAARRWEYPGRVAEFLERENVGMDRIWLGWCKHPGFGRSRDDGSAGIIVRHSLVQDLGATGVHLPRSTDAGSTRVALRSTYSKYLGVQFQVSARGVLVLHAMRRPQ